MSMHLKLYRIVPVLLLSIATCNAYAGLIGTDVQASRTFTILGGTTNIQYATVTNGLEFDYWSRFDVDISDDIIRFDR